MCLVFLHPFEYEKLGYQVYLGLLLSILNCLKFAKFQALFFKENNLLKGELSK
jgi:hypothetical protein